MKAETVKEHAFVPPRSTNRMFLPSFSCPEQTPVQLVVLKITAAGGKICLITVL